MNNSKMTILSLLVVVATVDASYQYAMGDTIKLREGNDRNIVKVRVSRPTTSKGDRAYEVWATYPIVKGQTHARGQTITVTERWLVENFQHLVMSYKEGVQGTLNKEWKGPTRGPRGTMYPRQQSSPALEPKNTNSSTKVIKSNPLTWSAEKVTEWLTTVCVPAHGINKKNIKKLKGRNGAAFFKMDRQALNNAGVKNKDKLLQFMHNLVPSQRQNKHVARTENGRYCPETARFKANHMNQKITLTSEALKRLVNEHKWPNNVTVTVQELEGWEKRVTGDAPNTPQDKVRISFMDPISGTVTANLPLTDIIRTRRRRRLKTPFGIEALEALLEECRAHGYQG